MFQLGTDQHLTDAKIPAFAHTYHPNHTVKCHGKALFRSQQARNVGCAIGLDSSVLSWPCLPVTLQFDGDYLVDRMPPPD